MHVYTVKIGVTTEIKMPVEEYNMSMQVMIVITIPSVMWACMCFASGDITQKWYTRKKARLEEKFDTSKELAESVSVRQSHEDPVL